MKKGNIAVFIPHLGCPNDCSFCNQKLISSTLSPATPEDCIAACDKAALNPNLDTAQTEIAFFGGSFTAIGREMMTGLLSAAQSKCRQYGFKGIRISTRPDCIDDNILKTLKEYDVTAIELGAQSMLDEVLTKNARGHTAADVEKASALIKRAGFELGLQMMTGLFGDSGEGALITARKIAGLAPDTVRIYPTVVLEGTRLCELWRKGLYNPPGVDETVLLCADLLEIFEAAGINVIKLGLHASETMSAQIVAGAYHPALRELCEAELFRRIIFKSLAQIPKDAPIELLINPKNISKLTGHGAKTLEKIAALGYNCKVTKCVNIKKVAVKML